MPTVRPIQVAPRPWPTSDRRGSRAVAQRVQGELTAFIELDSGVARRGIAGLVTHLTRVATTISVTNRRRYRVVIEPSTVRLRLTQRSRVFQKMKIPDIVQQVLVDGGFEAGRIQLRTSQEHPEQRYVVQYNETDEAFLRRTCERGGLYYHFIDLGEASDTLQEGIVVADDSSTLEPDLEVDLAHGSNLEGLAPVGRRLVLAGRLRTGKVALRDYDPAAATLRTGRPRRLNHTRVELGDGDASLLQQAKLQQ